MSYSSLWGIKPNYVGEELIDYPNSWFFTPIVMSVLPEKYIPEDIFTGSYKNNILLGFHSQDLFRKTNDKVNNCGNLPDRICWELANQQIFFTRDKKIIADSIRQFVLQNREYDKSDEDNISSLEREHIMERFHKIADDIEQLNEQEYPYFVFKGTSCDDNVEFWFRSYNEDDEEVEKSLPEWNDENTLAEFVVIENNAIVEFISNRKFNYS